MMDSYFKEEDWKNSKSTTNSFCTKQDSRATTEIEGRIRSILRSTYEVSELGEETMFLQSGNRN